MRSLLPFVALLLSLPGVASAVTLFSTNGFSWNLDEDDHGEVVNGNPDTFDSFPNLCVAPSLALASACDGAGVEYDLAAWAGTLEESGQEIVMDPLTLSGLSVQRKIYAPPTGSETFLRYLEVLTNPSGAPITVDVRVGSTALSADLGCNNTAIPTSCVVTSSASGDTTASNNETWWVVDDNATPTGNGGGTTDNAVGFVVGQAGGTQTTWTSEATDAYGNGDTGDSFVQFESVTVPANSTRILMWFLVQRESSADAAIDAALLAELNVTTLALAGMSATEQSQVLNWGMTQASNNTAPVANNDSISATEDASGSTNLLSNDTDADGDGLSVTQVNGSGGNVGSPIPLGSGLLTVTSDGTATFNPAGGYETLTTGGSASASFTYTVSDGSATDGGSVSVSISGLNDAPAPSPGGPYTGLEGSPVALNGAGSSDIDGTVITWQWDCEANGGFEVTASSPTGSTCTYADDGSYQVLLSVTDAQGGSAGAQAAVTISNVAPSITSTASTTTGTVGVAWSYAPVAVDPGADTLSWIGSGTPAGMTVDSGTGAVAWTPASTGSVTFTVTVSDGDGGSDSEVITVLVGAADSDGDGLPDPWETANGLDPNNSADATLDGDADGLDNLAEYQGGTDPNSFDGPTAPTLLAPVAGAEVGDAQPELSWDAASDPQGDALLYTVEVYGEAALSTLLASASALGSPTTWTVDVALPENQLAWWRVQAADANVAGPWTPAESFLVNASNEAPEAPSPLSPVDVTVDSSFPTLQWSNAADPDGDVVTYSVEVWDAELTALQASADGLAEEVGSSSSWTVDVELAPEADYVWRVGAVDAQGLAGPLSADAGFTVSLVNSAPGATLIVSPTEGEGVETRSPSVELSETSDPEGDAFVYVVQVDTVASFDGADFAETVIAGDSAERIWDLAAEGVTLNEHATGYLRAWAEDSGGRAGPVDEVSFFVRGPNDAPPVPVLRSPIDGIETDSATPSLRAAAPADIEGDAVVLDFTVYADAEGTEVLASAEGVPVSDGEASWTVDVQLDGAFLWTARARDDRGASSEFAPLANAVTPGTTDGGCACESSLSAAPAAGLWSLLLLIPALRRRRDRR